MSIQHHCPYLSMPPPSRSTPYCLPISEQIYQVTGTHRHYDRATGRNSTLSASHVAHDRQMPQPWSSLCCNTSGSNLQQQEYFFSFSFIPPSLSPSNWHRQANYFSMLIHVSLHFRNPQKGGFHTTTVGFQFGCKSENRSRCKQVPKKSGINAPITGGGGGGQDTGKGKQSKAKLYSRPVTSLTSRFVLNIFISFHTARSSNSSTFICARRNKACRLK